ncbi:HNH endonuclease [Pseudomonas sp. MRSN 12121]|uniref:HNH endonuclease n=1 Tax=Pseudomonas sp. MRSN 12121 TaxID=1611770 RepID=UPI0005BEDABF|nr:HNH endonuclease [Pseudomonas sp. MRSN 12121]AJO76485.1 HNH endonuclease [Pseudomonas sp. MRSN 12121]AJO77786.1 HNH endonuclease [Pseudomonas sp. MRSN 12121]
MARLKTLRSRVQTQADRLPAVNTNSWRATKETSAQRGYGYKWQKAREVWLRDNPLCVYCERAGRVAAGVVVDHKVAHRGDMDLFWDRSNWQTLCKHCHDSVKQAEEAADWG